MPETQSSDRICPKLQSIAERAKRRPGEALTTLAHVIDVDLLRVAFDRTRKDGAPGVDGQSASEYAANLEVNLRSLLDRAQSGTYRAPAVRRVRIPKGEVGQTRSLGIPTFEDKVLQRAVLMVLESVYEVDFHSSSYGFRPGRSAHQALGLIREGLASMGGGSVLELDIESCFDSIPRKRLLEVLRRRVNDGVLVRLIGKWLNAGVLESGSVRYPDSGTPQGGVISPLLCNVYLHEVLDEWLEQTVRPRLGGRMQWVRYADDAVLWFERDADARRVEAVLAQRFGKYGLRLKAEKTRRVQFRRPGGPVDPAPSRPETFAFLGFQYYWGRARGTGRWAIKLRTAKDRFRRSVRAVKLWCQRNRHVPIPDQHRILARKLRGHYAYFGWPGNAWALSRFRNEVLKAWRKWLSRRSGRARLSWGRFEQMKQRHPLPYARILPRPVPSLSVSRV